MLLLLLSVTSAEAQSEGLQRAIDASDERIDGLISERDAVLDEIEQSLRALEHERQDLKQLVVEQRISLDVAKDKYAEIGNKYDEIVSNLRIANAKRQEIISEYRLYRHQERAKVVLPTIVALLAYGFSNESGGARVVEGFAGYGAAAALEAAGYGLGKPIGRLTFTLTEW